MKKGRNFVFLTLTVLLINHVLGLAQSNWEESLKGENGMVGEKVQEVDISVDESGELIILSKVHEETMHFNDNAIMYSEQSIGFSETFTELYDLEAYSHIPKGNGKFKKIKVTDFVTSDSRSDGVFYDDQKKISFVFPALKAGSKTEISYTKRYKEPRLWGYFMFSSFFPVEKSRFTVTTSSNIKLDYLLYGIDEDLVKFTKEEKGKKTMYTWSADELSKISMSPGSDGVLHSAPHLIIHVDSYEYNGENHQVLGDVADLHTWYQKFLNGIDDENSDSLEKMVNSIVKGKSTEMQKVEAIYYWVQQNIKYIAIEDGLGGFRPRTANTVFARRYGDCKDMSNLLHKMFNLAQIPTNLAWIGTTSIPYSHKEVPTPMADNHMICTYINGDQYFFLDATDQYNILGMPTSHIQGREALVNKGEDDFELVDVPVVPPEQNQIIDSVFLTVDNDKLLGKGKVIYTGYNRIPITINLENLQENDKNNFLNSILKKGNNKFLLSAAKAQHVSEKNLDLEIDYNFSVDDYIFNVSDEIFVNPHLDKRLEGGLIDQSAIEKNIHYPFKNITSNVFSVDIPENYSVSHLPKNRSYQDDDFSFTIDYKVDQDKVIMQQHIIINTIELDTTQFDSWNKMIRGLFAAYKESIVFKKI